MITSPSPPFPVEPDTAPPLPPPYKPSSLLSAPIRPGLPPSPPPLPPAGLLSEPALVPAEEGRKFISPPTPTPPGPALTAPPPVPPVALRRVPNELASPFAPILPELAPAPPTPTVTVTLGTSVRSTSLMAFPPPPPPPPPTMPLTPPDPPLPPAPMTVTHALRKPCLSTSGTVHSWTPAVSNTAMFWFRSPSENAFSQ